MRYVSLKKFKTLSALALAVIASSCSMKSNGQQQSLTIALPGANFVQNPILKSMTEWISLAWASTTTSLNLDSDPANLSEFDCFAVNVNGPGINLDPNVTCSDPSDAPAIFGGFVPNGNSSIDLVVPAGPDRTIKILGIKSLVGCPDLHDMIRDGTINHDNVGHFYAIGSTRQDIFSDALVTIKASYSATSPMRAFEQCKRTGETNTSHVWNVFAPSGSAGIVNATKTVNGISYIGGTFDYVGPITQSGAMLSQLNGANASTSNSPAHISGTVRCSVPDGRGGFYVGGAFSHVESTAYSSNNAVLIHLNYDGSFDPSFVVQELGYSTSVYACAFDASTSTLFLGGNFTQLSLDGTTFTPSNALAAVTVSTPGITNMGSVISATSPQVFAMDLDRVRNRLYVGGTFALTGALNGYNNVAAFSSLAATSYAADTSWHPNPNGSVTAIYADTASLDGFVYIGGSFLSPQSYLFRTAANGAVGAGWNPGLAGTAYSIVKGGANFYVAAHDAANVPQIYQIDATTATLSGSPLLSASGTPDSFSSIALSSDGSQLYVGGKFLISGHQNLISISILSATGGTPAVNPNFNSNTNSNAWVYTVATNAVGKLFVGGTFTSVGGVLRTNIAAIDLSSGRATEWNSPYHNIGPVTAIESDGNYIYAGYDQIYSTLAPGVFKTSISSPFTASGNWSTGSNVTDHVLTLNLQNSDLYVGGQFSTLNSATGLRNIARLDAGSGSVSSWKPVIGSTSENVSQIAVDGNRVFLSGNFTTINSATTMLSLVAIDSSTGALSSWSNPGLSGGVDSMLIIPANTYSFAPSGALIVGSGSSIKLVDPSGTVMSWSNAPNISTMMTKTFKLARSGDALYIGGYANGTTGQALLAYDLAGQALFPGFQPRIQNYNQVKSIEVFDHGVMLVGGNFQQVRVNAADGSGGMMDWGLGLFNAGTGEFY